MYECKIVCRILSCQQTVCVDVYIDNIDHVILPMQATPQAGYILQQPLMRPKGVSILYRVAISYGSAESNREGLYVKSLKQATKLDLFYLCSELVHIIDYVTISQLHEHNKLMHTCTSKLKHV